jgi:hypothetical protein
LLPHIIPCKYNSCPRTPGDIKFCISESFPFHQDNR